MGEDGFLYATFNGNPGAENTITLNYSTTKGSAMNTISAGSIVNCNIDLLALATGPTEIQITNNAAPNGGADLETIDVLRRRIPLSLRTLDRAVTYQDYYDMLQLAPGVEKGEIDFCCSNADGVVLYVVPHGGGLAGNSLLNNVSVFFDKKRVIGTKITPRPAGEVGIIFQVEAVIFSGENSTDSVNLILNTLRNNYTYLNQEINQSVRLSDVITLISNLKPVDYIKSLIVDAIPYPKPVGSTTNPLNITFYPQVNATTKVVYRVIYNGTNWVVYRINLEWSTVLTGVVFDNDEVSFRINASTYTPGDEYEFTVYPHNEDIVITDFTIPIFNVDSTVSVSRDSESIRNKNC
jgi:hypothetical protein